MRPLGRILGGIVAMVLGAAIVIMGGLVFVLSQGPIPLDRLRPWIESQLASAVPDFEIRFKDPSLVWSAETRALALRVTDVRVRGPQGQRLLAVPKLLVDLDLTEILRTGRLVIEEISIDGPRMRVVRKPDGSYDFGQQGVENEEGAGKLILARLLASGERRQRLPIQAIVVRGAEIVLVDAAARTRIVAAQGQLALSRDDAGEPELTGHFTVAGGVVSVLLKPRADGVIVAEAIIRGVRPATVATSDDPDLALLLERRLSGSFQAVIHDIMTSRPRFEVRLGAGSLVLDGRLTETLGIPRLTAKGTLDLNEQVVETPSLILDVPPITAQGHARLAFADGLQLTGTLVGGAATLPDVLAWWPDELAPGTKRWIAEHVAMARASDATFEFAWSSALPEARGMNIQFTVTDAEVAFLDGFPAAMGIQGIGRFDLKTFAFDLTSGQLGGLQANDARLDIQLRKPGPALLATSVTLVGPVPDALRIVEMLPNKLNPHLPVEPSNTGGSGTYLVKLNLPIQKEIPREAADFKVTAEIEDGVAVLFGGALQLARAEITLEVTPDDLTGRGELLVNGIEANLVPATKPRGARGALRLEGGADRSRLSAAGLPVLPWFEGGTLGLDLTVVVREGRPLELDLVVDLAAASINVPSLALTKPTGGPGRLEFAAFIQGDVVNIPHLSLSAADLDARASASIVPRSRIARFDVLGLSLGDTTLTGVLERTDAEMWRADLHASTLDLRRWLHLERPGPSLLAAGMGASVALDLHLLADQARLPGGSLHDLDLTLSRSESQWETMEARAGLNTAQKIRASLEPAKDGTHTFKLATDDAAGLLSSLDPAATYPEGGTLRLDGTLLSQRPLDFKGRILVREFMVRGAPVLAKIFTLASLTGIENTLQGEGIHFERARADLGFRNGTMTITNGKAHGSEVGLTSSGTINFDAGEIALSGTVVPFYTLNHILAQVPLLGTLLAGREQMGAFAATYSIAGRLSAPVFAVNPLSVIVPGFVRDLFSDAASADRPFEVQTERGRRPD